MDTNNTRLRIATRIHFALLRHLGEGIDVGTMLKNDAEAREVLWVCEASGDAELIALARQYVRAGMLSDEAKAGGHAAQDTPWARDTSGFGVSHPPEVHDAHETDMRKRTSVSSSWLNPASWLRRDH